MAFYALDIFLHLKDSLSMEKEKYQAHHQTHLRSISSFRTELK